MNHARCEPGNATRLYRRPTRFRTSHRYRASPQGCAACGEELAILRGHAAQCRTASIDCRKRPGGERGDSLGCISEETGELYGKRTEPVDMVAEIITVKRKYRPGFW